MPAPRYADQAIPSDGRNPNPLRLSYQRSIRLDDVLENRRRAQHAAGADRARRQLTVLLDELVEVEQILVETEHVGGRRCQRVARTHVDAVGDGIDAELAAPLREPDCAPRGIGSVVSSTRASRSRRLGGNSATPCDAIVRAKSTGSPPAPRSGMSATRVTVFEFARRCAS